MESDLNINRRNFIKTLACGTVVTLSFKGLSVNILSASENSRDSTHPAWAPIPGKANWRIDGMAKVLGKKIFARDYRARDIDGWPNTERYLYPIRADRNNQVITSYDLSVLPPELSPMVVIDSEVIARDNIDLAGGMIKPFFVKLGNTADYFGQPIAMLIFENFDVYRKAKIILQFNQQVIEYGKVVKRPDPKMYSPSSAYIRDDESGFDYVNNNDDYDNLYPVIADNIEKAIDESDWNLFEREFKSQTTDPVFMEPESGLAWFNKDDGELRLVLGTQSPAGDMWKIADIFGHENCSFKLSHVDLMACYPGGGFGGRDDSYFPKYLGLCAAYADGPLRWVHDRYEQFQVGLKRHETNFKEQIALDNDGIIKALKSEFIMNGGGRRNLSPYVAQLSAISSSNSYDISKAISYAKAVDTPDLIGGSQRGFGGPQAFMAIETLLDEAAIDLKIDPFEIRRRNLLDKNSKTITGAPVHQELQLTSILDELEKQPLWQNRLAKQKIFEEDGLNYGVGLALTNRAYGTEGDGMYGGVEIKKNGQIVVHTPYIDMGNGAATALGLAPAKYLGRNASDINMGEVAFFDQLDLTTSYREISNIVTRALTKFGWADDDENSKYVSHDSGSSSACLAAFHQFHVVEQAGLALLLQTILPAAAKIWQTQPDYNEIVWRDGKLTLKDYEDLSWSVIVKTIFEERLPNIASVHASFVSEFTRADYKFTDYEVNLPLDYVAMGNRKTDLTPILRSNITYPPRKADRYKRSRFAPCGALIAVSVNPKTRQVQIEHCISVLSAGKQLCPEIVKGQSEGGVAMSIGYVFFEDCLNTNDGPGNGTWNLDQYRIPGLSDIPKKQNLIVLEAPEGEESARGIAEAVLCPIAPAILNALSAATSGHRFSKLPITEDDIKEALS